MKERLQALLEKIKQNKETVIKIGLTVLGGLVGVIAVAVVNGQREQVYSQSEVDSFDWQEGPDEEETDEEEEENEEE
jgi:hypothetical protein